MTDLVTALGPGQKLDSLSSFAPEYGTVRRAFNGLLVFPHLEAIQVGDTSNTSLLSLITDGNSRFSDLANIDVDLARKVISYNATLSALVDSLNVQLLVMTMQPVAQGYADHARADFEDNQKFFSNFVDYTASVDDRIAAMDDALAQLDAQIQAQSDALASKSIIATLWDVLKTLYKLASTADDSDVQIAAILGVTISTIVGSFQNLWADQARLQKIISSLQGLRTRIQDLKKRFVALSSSLKAVITSSSSLLDVWDDVAARMNGASDNTDLVPADQAAQLKSAWAQVASDAQAYIDILQQPSTDLPDGAVRSHRIISAKFNAYPKVPLTGAEIAMYKLAVQYGVDPLYIAIPGTNATVQLAASNSDQQTIETVLGPPVATQDKLNELADDTGRIIDQFNTLLQQPFLDQYKCTSPIDGSDSDVYTVMNYYRTQYTTLQQDTLPVARDLGSYAGLQIALLPFVAPDAQAQATDLPMSVFLETNTPLVADYQIKADDLSKRSTQVKNDWDNVVNLVNRLIAESDQNIKTWSDSIDDLTEQQRQMTIYASLAAFGAFLAFTAAVFLPGIGMLVAVGIGGALGGIAVWQAISAAQITITINELRAAISNAENTKAHLQDLLRYCTNIASSLSAVSLIWSDITTALTNLNTFFDVLNGPTGPQVFVFLRPQIINNWVAVQDSVQKYINTVAS